MEQSSFRWKKKKKGNRKKDDLNEIRIRGELKKVKE